MAYSGRYNGLSCDAALIPHFARLAVAVAVSIWVSQTSIPRS